MIDRLFIFNARLSGLAIANDSFISIVNTKDLFLLLSSKNDDAPLGVYKREGTRKTPSCALANKSKFSTRLRGICGSD